MHTSSWVSSTPRIKRLHIYNYRSVGEDWVTIEFPSNKPLVLIGENNAGKSNILRALSLILGESWAGSHAPEDHEFFGRSSAGKEIRIHAETTGIPCPKGCNSSVTEIIWKYCDEDTVPCEYTVKSSGCSHTYMANAIKNQLSCILIGTERDLSYQMSYASKWTSLSKLMRRFHSHLIHDDDRVEKLKGIYSDLVNTFYEVDEFRIFSEALKVSTSDFGGNLPYGLDIDFSAYDASNFFRSLRLFPHLEGESRSYEELGTGQGQILAIAFSYAYARAFGGSGLVLAIEEPESHLHPLAQQWLAGKLNELAKAGVQVIITTHSPYFITLTNPGTTVLTRKINEKSATSVTQLKPRELVDKVVAMGSPANIVTAANVGPFYENSSTTEIKAGLFARGCILVEGATEAMGLPIFLKRAGYDLVKLGIATISVEGLWNIPKWVRYFRAHDVPVYPIFDTDSEKTGRDSQKAQTARQDILLSLDLDSSLDWYDYTNGPIGVEDKFAVLDSNYEIAFRHAFGTVYSELEDEARELVGSSKSLVSRYVAGSMPLRDEEFSLIWGWDLVKKIGEYATAMISISEEDNSSYS